MEGIDIPRVDFTQHGLPGYLVVVDGSDGTGKTTLLANLESALESEGHRVVRTRQPTTEARESAAFKDYLFEPESRDGIDYRALLCLMIGDRLQHQFRTIRPALLRGETVLCDRYIFTQMVTTVTRGHSDEDWMLQLYPHVFAPDVAVITDAPADLVVSRIAARVDARESFYERDHVERNLLAYRRVASAYSLDVVDTSVHDPGSALDLVMAQIPKRARQV